MTESYIHDRIADLINVHAYTNITNTYLSVNQRICLTQERAAWMSVLDETYPDDHEPRYVIPAHLEYLVEKVLRELSEQNWIKPEYKKEPY